MPAQSVQDYLIAKNDNYRPIDPKPSLQQYGNYQLDDLYCTDIVIIETVNGVQQPEQLSKKNNFLAVQAYSARPITVNFSQIVQQYPGNY
jgi:hypothetical protein